LIDAEDLMRRAHELLPLTRMPRVATSTLRSVSMAQSWNDRRRDAEFTEPQHG